MTSRQQQKTTEFWKKKEEALQNYGKAASRPQDNFRSYLIAKRRLNFGYDIPCNSKTITIANWNFPTNKLQIDVFKSGDTNFIDTPTDFSKMITYLKKCNEISLDLECNVDHSHSGMTSLLQIGTVNYTFLIDPYPLFEEIKDHLIPILESPEVVKIMLGCANDVQCVNRDFMGNLVAVIDLQQVHKSMLKTLLSLINNPEAVAPILKKFPRWLNAVLGFDVADEVKDPNQLADLKNRSNQLISMNDIAKLYFSDITLPSNCATFADWRIRPLPPALEEYATFDVHSLLKVWQRVKKLIIEFPVFESAIHDGIQGTKKLLNKNFSMPADLPLQDLLTNNHSYQFLTSQNKEILQMLLEFRRIHAKIVDEPEDGIFTVSEAIKLLHLKMKTPEHIKSIMQQRQRKIPPECVDSWIKPTIRLLTEKQLFFTQLMSKGRCHVCRGDFDYPHLAWGCCKKYSQQAVNEFMSCPENQHFNTKEDARRWNNWKTKYGDIPCPYLKPRTN